MEIDAYDIYGLSEIIGPGVAIECPRKNGLHIAEDHFIPEIIDPRPVRFCQRVRLGIGFNHRYQRALP